MVKGEGVVPALSAFPSQIGHGSQPTRRPVFREGFRFLRV